MAASAASRGPLSQSHWQAPWWQREGTRAPGRSLEVRGCPLALAGTFVLETGHEEAAAAWQRPKVPCGLQTSKDTGPKAPNIQPTGRIVLRTHMASNPPIYYRFIIGGHL